MLQKIAPIRQLQSRTSTAEVSKSKKFSKYDRKVLCFNCCWDDSQSLFGDKLPYILHYYLVDDTLEIRETKESAVGRDPFPIFLKRRKLPKNSYAVGKTVWITEARIVTSPKAATFSPHNKSTEVEYHSITWHTVPCCPNLTCKPS